MGQRYSVFQRLIQKFAATQVGAWFFARSAHRLDKLFLKLTGGKSTLVSIVSGLPALVITTTGTKSGMPRTLTLVFIRDGQDATRVALVASNFGQSHRPGWYYNLKANPRTICTVEGKTMAYLAHEAQGEEYDRWWKCTTRTFYGYQVYRERAERAGRNIPIMVLTPDVQPNLSELE